MSVAIVPITRDNLELVSKAAAKFGMPRSTRWLERCLFDPTVEDLIDGDKVRGHMAIDNGNEVVAIQGYYYMPGYFRREMILLNTGCIMGVDSTHGAELFCCFDANKTTQKQGLLNVGNCIANNRSAKICKIYSDMCDAPEATRERRIAVPDFSSCAILAIRRVKGVPECLLNIAWRCLRPLSWLQRRIVRAFRCDGEYKIVLCDAVDEEKFGDFWSRFLERNNGLVTSRAPQRLAWLFNDSIKAGQAYLIVAQREGRIDGYAIVRRMPAINGQVFHGFQVCDICAVNRDERCLAVLARAMLDVVAEAGGLNLAFNGAFPEQARWLDKVFRFRRLEDHATFLYSTKDSAIAESLKRNEGWFFGPFDGERCLGSGGFVDL